MERFAHRAELRLEPGRLGPGDAERPRGGLGVEAEQMRAGRRRAKRADRAGRMKAAAVMSRPHRHADAALRLVTGDKRGDDVAAGAVALLGEREQAGQDRDGGMARHRQIDVVIVERVAHRAVDQGRGQHRQSRLVADDARLRRRRRRRARRRAGCAPAGRRGRLARRRNNRVRIAAPMHAPVRAARRR